MMMRGPRWRFRYGSLIEGPFSFHLESDPPGRAAAQVEGRRFLRASHHHAIVKVLGDWHIDHNNWGASREQKGDAVFENMEDGVPAGEVRDVAQTADGFLWITTTAGKEINAATSGR